MANEPAAPADGAPVAKPGDLPAAMGAHGAIHMNTPAPKPADPAPVADPAKPADPAAPADPAKPGVAAMPEAGFEKFYTKDTGAYNWEAHAKEAEFKLSQPGKEPAKAVETTLTEGGAKEGVAAAGLDWDVLGEKIGSTGTIEESDFVALEGIGLPREIITEYITLAVAHRTERVKQVTTALGGDMAPVIEWSLKNLSQDERDGYDTMLNGDNWKPAAAALRAQMGLAPAATVPGGAPLPTPNASGPGASDEPAFANQDELNAAIADKKYRADPTYRAAVMRRASKSTYATNTRSHPAGL